MGILKRQGEQTTPDFIEDDFISALETSMSRTFYYRDKFIEVSRISQTDENILGYDGVLTTIVPFYIQFKRSNFYSPLFAGELMKNRKKISLSTSQGFFAFELLKKEDKYSQHNTMFLLSQNAKAAYVAPMFYKKADLTNMKNVSSNILTSNYGNIEVFDYHFDLNYNFTNVRLFRNCITIPPHALINDKNSSHHYSYCRNLEIGFHSDPINLEDSNSKNFFYFIEEILRQEKSKDLENQTELLFSNIPEYFGLERNSDEFIEIIVGSIKRVSITDSDSNFVSIIAELTMFDKLLILEDILYQYFGIRQFIRYESMF